MKDCPRCGNELTLCESSEPDEENSYKLIYACNEDRCRLDYVYLYMLVKPKSE